MAATADPQTSLYETVLENEELEKLLEKREALRVKKSDANALYVEADEKAKALIGTLDFGQDAPVRIGRFVVTRTLTKPRSVAFETESKVQLRIGTITEDGE